MINDLSPQFKWKEQLEKKEKKVKKKDLPSMMAKHIKSESQQSDGYWIKGTNFMGNEVLIHCATKDECLANLATLNGVTIT
jgi:hypothetical protein